MDRISNSKSSEGQPLPAEAGAAEMALESESQELVSSSKRKTFERLRGGLVLVAAVAVFGWLYAGFYYPDPYFFEGYSAGGHRLLLLAIRILLPVLGLGALVLYAAVRSRRLPLSALGLVGVGFVLGLLILHSFATTLYFKALSGRSMERYHPFLQISPPEIGAFKDGPAIRILALGGSTTEWRNSRGIGWPALVEEKLNQSRGERRRPVEIKNAAKEWYTTAHTLINYSLNLRHLHPDVILVMHAINDLLMNADFSYLSTPRHFSADYRHSYGPLSRMLAPPKDPFLHVIEKMGLAWYYEPRQVVRTETFAGIASYRRNLETLIDYAQRDGARVVLITQPHLLKEQMPHDEYLSLHMVRFEAVGPSQQWDVQTALSGMRQYNDAARAIARERSVALIDLEPEVPKTTEYFSDEVHYRDKAYPLIAEFVSRRLGEIVGE